MNPVCVWLNAELFIAAVANEETPSIATAISSANVVLIQRPIVDCIFIMSPLKLAISYRQPLRDCLYCIFT
jgi:hypothetical protein